MKGKSLRLPQRLMTNKIQISLTNVCDSHCRLITNIMPLLQRAYMPQSQRVRVSSLPRQFSLAMLPCIPSPSTSLLQHPILHGTSHSPLIANIPIVPYHSIHSSQTRRSAGSRQNRTTEPSVIAPCSRASLRFNYRSWVDSGIGE